MELYIGGYAQGKLAYVQSALKDSEYNVFDGAAEENYTGEHSAIFYHFHEWFKNQLKSGKNPESYVNDMLENKPDMIIICDEIGNGIIPMEKEERIYRERLGRCLCEIAKQAERVERVVCGIGQRIK